MRGGESNLLDKTLQNMTQASVLDQACWTLASPGLLVLLINTTSLLYYKTHLSMTQWWMSVCTWCVLLSPGNGTLLENCLAWFQVLQQYIKVREGKSLWLYGKKYCSNQLPSSAPSPRGFGVPDGLILVDFNFNNLEDLVDPVLWQIVTFGHVGLHVPELAFTSN